MPRLPGAVAALVAVACVALLVLTRALLVPAAYDFDWHRGVLRAAEVAGADPAAERASEQQLAAEMRKLKDDVRRAVAQVADMKRKYALLRGAGGGAERGEEAGGETSETKNTEAAGWPPPPEIPAPPGTAPPECLWVPSLPAGYGPSVLIAGEYGLVPGMPSYENRPVWSKVHGNWFADRRFLFPTDGGRWMITGQEDEVLKRMGWILSSEGRHPGLVASWQGTSENGWVNLPNWRVYPIEPSRCRKRPLALPPRQPPSPTATEQGVSGKAGRMWQQIPPYGDAPVLRYLGDVPGGLRLPSTLISPRPVAFHVPRLLDDDECDKIIALASPMVQRSLVHSEGSNDTNEGKPNDVRTSSNTWLPRRADPVVARVMDRILAMTGFERGDNEDMQVLRYRSGEFYRAHVDQFPQPTNGAHRAVTVLLYLSEPSGGGGETALPRAGGLATPQKGEECSQGLRVLPRRGSGLMLYGLLPDGRCDELALHAGCPPHGGEGWKGTVWIWAKVPPAAGQR